MNDSRDSTPYDTLATRPRDRFDCALVGTGTLLIRCAELLLRDGHTIRCVVSDDAVVGHWADQEGVAHGNDIALLANQSFDYLFSIVNGLVLPRHILDLPRRDAINYHDGPLPRYGGVHVTSWALINRETTHGVTWHLMADRVDAGDILKQRLVAIAPDDTALTLNAACYEAAVDAFVELLPDLASGRVVVTAQDPRERTFFARYKRPAQAGVLSFARSAHDLAALVRALTFGPYANPLGLAKLYVDGAFIVVTALDVLPTSAAALPGTITALDRDALRVATADHEIAVRSVMTIDGGPLTIPDVVARCGLHEGYRFVDLDEAIAARVTPANAAICRHESFWARRLEDVRPLGASQLPHTVRQAPPADIPPRAIIPLPLEEIVPRLADVEGAACSLLVAAFGAYLARLTGATAFDLGFVDARVRRVSEGLEGLFAARTPLRIDVELERNIGALSDSVSEGITAVRERLTYARDIVARYPGLRAVAEQEGGAALPITVDIVASVDDYYEQDGAILSLIIVGNGAEAYCCYDTAILDQESAERIAGQFVTFLRGLAAEPGRRLADLPLLTAEERHQLLVEWNSMGADYPRDRCIHELFEEQAARTPDATAVVYDDTSLTYRALDERANRLAHHLRGLGVGPETLVGLCVERSPAMVVGLLGILKAGGAYVPLDPAYPAERLTFMLRDTRARPPNTAAAARPVPRLRRRGCPPGRRLAGHRPAERGAGAGNDRCERRQCRLHPLYLRHDGAAQWRRRRAQGPGALRAGGGRGVRPRAT